MLTQRTRSPLLSRASDRAFLDDHSRFSLPSSGEAASSLSLLDYFRLLPELLDHLLEVRVINQVDHLPLVSPLPPTHHLEPEQVQVACPEEGLVHHLQMQDWVSMPLEVPTGRQQLLPILENGLLKLGSEFLYIFETLGVGATQPVFQVKLVHGYLDEEQQDVGLRRQGRVPGSYLTIRLLLHCSRLLRAAFLR